MNSSCWRINLYRSHYYMNIEMQLMLAESGMKNEWQSEKEFLLFHVLYFSKSTFFEQVTKFPIWEITVMLCFLFSGNHATQTLRKIVSRLLISIHSLSIMDRTICILWIFFLFFSINSNFEQLPFQGKFRFFQLGISQSYV